MNTTTLSCTQFERAFHADFQRTAWFIASRGVPPDAAEEVAQAAWARAWECRHQLREVSALAAWVNRIAINLLRTAARKARRTVGLEGAPEPVCHMETTALDAEGLLNRCRRDDRDLLRQHYMDDRSIEEIARELGVNSATVRVRLFRTRRAVRSLVSAH